MSYRQPIASLRTGKKLQRTDLLHPLEQAMSDFHSLSILTLPSDDRDTSQGALP